MLLWLHPWQYILYDIKMSINMAEILTQTHTHTAFPLPLFLCFVISPIQQLFNCPFAFLVSASATCRSSVFPLRLLFFLFAIKKQHAENYATKRKCNTEERQHKLLRALGRKNMVESIVETERNSSECCSSCRPLGQASMMAGGGGGAAG